MAKSPVEVKLIPIEATPETFADYGQIIEASRDGASFGPDDAQLDLSRGTPRFYILRLEGRSLGFSNITHHANVTQCLGSIGAHVWYLGVAKPSLIEDDDDNGRRVDAVESKSGHLYIPPAVEEIRVFRISGPKFVKLNRGTWHAGPLFRDGSSMDFYNLELTNTNEVDHSITRRMISRRIMESSSDLTPKMTHGPPSSNPISVLGYDPRYTAD